MDEFDVRRLSKGATRRNEQKQWRRHRRADSQLHLGHCPAMGRRKGVTAKSDDAAEGRALTKRPLRSSSDRSRASAALSF